MSPTPSFRLLQLAIVGPDVAPAVVDFTAGLNVIYGASDTGKSYVLEALEWCLGRTDLVKTVPEADGYTQAVLTLVSNDASAFTLRRALGGGEIEVFSGRGDKGDVAALGKPTVLNAKADSKKRKSLSTFLLEKCALAGCKIRVDEDGKTERLTFSVLRKIVIIDEQSVIKTKSPFSTPQWTEGTKYRSLLRLLLTGLDDSAIVQPGEDRAITSARSSGRTQAYDDVIAKLEDQLASMDVSPLEIEDALAVSDGEESGLRDSLAAASAGVAQLETARREKWLHAERERSRHLQLAELLKRFALLEEQYGSDVRRLESTIEAGRALDAVPSQPCLLCGLVGGTTHDHEDSVNLIEACQRELKKVALLQQDLGRTITALSAERDAHQAAAAKATAEHVGLQSEIRERLQPLQNSITGRIGHLLDRRVVLERAVLVRDQILAMHAKREESSTTGDAPSSTSDRPQFQKHAPSHLLDAFSKTVQGLLVSWGFPSAARVSFNPATDDFIIDGKERGAFGKGYRAVAHAACTIGLMIHAKKCNKAYSGFVVLDSPLNPYEGPVDDGAEVSTDVKHRLLRSLAAELGEQQVLLLENKLPVPSDITNANFIQFTKSSEGRFGLFPPKRKPTP